MARTSIRYFQLRGGIEGWVEGLRGEKLVGMEKAEEGGGWGGFGRDRVWGLYKPNKYFFKNTKYTTDFNNLFSSKNRLIPPPNLSKTLTNYRSAIHNDCA